MDPTSGQRWQILFRQHAHLRGSIRSAQCAAHEVLAAHQGCGTLQARVLLLQGELLLHLADEERLLEPILASFDERGPVRAGLMRAEHAHQRAILAVLTGPMVWPVAMLLAGRTLSLCDDLLVDMEFEERELMNERVLPDDLPVLVAIEAKGA